MSKKVKYKPVNIDVTVQLTANGYYVPGADLSSEMWKRIEGTLKGRIALVDASQLTSTHLPPELMVVFNKTLINRGYIIERVVSRSLQYHKDMACIVNQQIVEWLVSEHKVPETITVLYDNGLEHPRNTTGGSTTCSLLENIDIRVLYRRARIISDSQGRVKKEIWRLK